MLWYPCGRFREDVQQSSESRAGGGGRARGRRDESVLEASEGEKRRRTRRGGEQERLAREDEDCAGNLNLHCSARGVGEEDGEEIIWNL